jgi:membrane peptidoglycan carboxypeptidase
MGINIEAATNGKVTQSIGLGGLDQGVTPVEMAGAYAVFANGGQRVKPHLIARIEDREGKVIYQARKASAQVLDPVVDAAMIDMMRGVVTGGTGTGAALPTWPVAGKTGTTTSNVDAWFVGYTPVLSTAVWVGHAEGQIEMPGMTGGSLPASIWRSYMGEVLDGREVVEFPDPDFDALADRMDSQQLDVPDVVRMTEAEALAALGKAKLIGVVQDEYSSATEGTVVWQSPGSDNTATPGETVYIGVSTGYVPPPPPPRSSGGGGKKGDATEAPADGEEPAPDEEEPTTDEEPDKPGKGNGGGGG